MAIGYSVAAGAAECHPLESAGHRFTVCSVDLEKDHLQIFLRDEKGRPFEGFARLESAPTLSTSTEPSRAFKPSR